MNPENIPISLWGFNARDYTLVSAALTLLYPDDNYSRHEPIPVFFVHISSLVGYQTSFQDFMESNNDFSSHRVTFSQSM